MKKRQKHHLSVAPVLLFASIVLITLLLLMFRTFNGPKWQETVINVQSADGKYTVNINVLDYGGSPGYEMKAYVKKNGPLNFFKEFPISQSLRQNLKCKPLEYAECPIPSESFEVKDGYIYWYNEKIKISSTYLIDHIKTYYLLQN